MKIAMVFIAACAMLAGCAAGNAPEKRSQIAPAAAEAPLPSLVVVEPSRTCAPLPELRPGASSTERRIHTQSIVRLYAACAERPPAKPQACELLAVAFDETGDLAPAWYLLAVVELERCGYPRARAKGNYRACLAEQRDGRDRRCEDLL